PVRPLDALQRLIDTCLQTQRGGLLAIELPDTLKRAQPGPEGAPYAYVQETVERSGLWIAQTPQMFKGQALLQALDQAHVDGVVVTDEAGAMESLGQPPLLVRGAPENLKVTWPEDFKLMEQWVEDADHAVASRPRFGYSCACACHHIDHRRGDYTTQCETCVRPCGDCCGSHR